MGKDCVQRSGDNILAIHYLADHNFI